MSLLKTAAGTAAFVVSIPVAIRVWQITGALGASPPQQPPPIDNSNPISRFADRIARVLTGTADESQTLGTILFDFFGTGETVQTMPSDDLERETDAMFFDFGPSAPSKESLFLPPSSDPFIEPKSPEEAFFTGG